MDPGTADDVDATLGPLPWNYVATCGQRSDALQTKDYAQGRTTPGPIITNAKPGDSAHEATPGGSRAVDFKVVLPDGSITEDENHPAWQAAIAAIRASKNLHSGADFPKEVPGAPNDFDHVENYDWAHTVNGVPPFHQRMKMGTA